MTTKTFNRAFGKLVGAFTDHQDVRRDPTNIAELGAARWRLEGARTTVGVERLSMERSNPARNIVGKRVAMSDAELARLRVMVTGSIQ